MGLSAAYDKPKADADRLDIAFTSQVVPFGTHQTATETAKIYLESDEFEEGDFRVAITRYSRENWPNVMKLADGLKTITLAWVLAQGDDIIPIPGTRSVKYLHENLDALKIKLSPEVIKEVRTITRNAGASSLSRYPSAAVGLTYANTPPLK
ncbi:hypothetical protein EUX98_g3985 [Antrodiella citrinella]|uniref:NADP-dependent oxidoreductase domain-containing protein n=1 Tax=Antrodiella citrinella TaxID=2447956 RepID=A0A4S4MXA5_9APHY|nr:hypothetical protein EUX98_g3985 [Antrodiella citrinella]